MIKNKKPLVYGMIFAVGLGFLLFKSIESRGGINNFSADSNSILKTDNSHNNDIELAPDFTLSTLDGGTVTLSSFRGQKPVILDFWASWCHNCQRDMPKLNKFYQKYKNDVEIIGINLRENIGTIEKFVNSNDIEFPIALDKGQVSNLYGIRFTNTHIYIDKNGYIQNISSQDTRESEIISLIEGE